MLAYIIFNDKHSVIINLIIFYVKNEALSYNSCYNRCSIIIVSFHSAVKSCRHSEQQYIFERYILT